MSAIDKKSYGKIIRDLITFFKGKKDDLLRQYRREMKNAAKERRFEEAATLRNRISFLTHIQDVAILKRENNEADKIEMGEMAVNPFGRIEGYDVSNISGTSTVASMVVFENGAPAKSEYRKFASRASLDQMTSRRFGGLDASPQTSMAPSGSHLGRRRSAASSHGRAGHPRGRGNARISLTDPRHRHRERSGTQTERSHLLKE